MGDIAQELFALDPSLQRRAKRGHNYILINCPFHQESRPSCSVSTEIPAFMCHGCKESGHISRLLRELGASAEQVKISLERTGLNKPRRRVTDALYQTYSIDPYRGEFALDDTILNVYRQLPLPLVQAGFSTDTLRHFEVGFDASKLRITFPLRNIYGELVGVSGRTVLEGVEPRYKIYRKELIDRKGYRVPKNYSMESVKKALLWHGHVARPFFYRQPDVPLVITEGFKACMWIYQAGYTPVVALVGSQLSKLHAELIAMTTKNAILFLDNDEPGQLATFYAAERLTRKGLRLRIANYFNNHYQQPDDLTPIQIDDAIRESLTFAEWKNCHDESDGPVRSAARRRVHQRRLQRQAAPDEGWR